MFWLILFLNSIVVIFGLAGCGGQSNTSNSRYWNVVLAGQSTASITFGSPLASPGIITGSTYSESNRNLYITGGAATCRLIQLGNTIIQHGGYTGSFPLDYNCIGSRRAA